MSSAYIYSINQFPVLCEVGMFGKYTIPARGKDERYSRIEIKERKHSLDQGNDRFVEMVEPGENIGKDILTANTGLGMILSTDSRGPTKDQIAVAEDEMRVADELRVSRGDMIFNRSKDRSQVSGDSRQACTRLGYVREWMDSPDSDRNVKRCRGCAEYILPQAIICKHCGWNQNVDPTAATAVMSTPQPAKAVVQG